MFLLFESAAGYAVFKVADRFEDISDAEVADFFEGGVKAKKLVKMTHFKKFKGVAEALQAATALGDGKLSKPLKKLLKNVFADEKDKLAVGDPKLGSLIKQKFQVQCLSDGKVMELIRGVRSHFQDLVGAEVQAREFTAMSLGLAHSLCRYRLKFSTDQIDTMVIQAVGLLDDLDCEINKYVMRCREWYSWHFPELSVYLDDHIQYVRVVKCVGMRKNAKLEQLKEFLPEDMVEKIEDLALHSMGTEITEEDNDYINQLCTQIIELDEYRTTLREYLQSRMNTLAPNMTTLVGEMVAAKLIAKAGSLLDLAKVPSSTVQILGAEKALFRALKAKRNTPKYGLIYHAQLITKTTPKLKGKVARMLAAKLSLSARVDAFRMDKVKDTSMALEHRSRLEHRVRVLEGVGPGSAGKLASKGGKPTSTWTPGSHVPPSYDTGLDSTLPSDYGRKRRLPDTSESPITKIVKSEAEESTEEHPSTSKKKKKKTSTGTESEELQAPDDETLTTDMTLDTSHGVEEKKKKKKKKHQLFEGGEAMQSSSFVDTSLDVQSAQDDTPGEGKKKKKKKRSEQAAEEEEMEETSGHVEMSMESSGLQTSFDDSGRKEKEKKKKKKKKHTDDQEE